MGLHFIGDVVVAGLCIKLIISIIRYIFSVYAVPGRFKHVFVQVE